MFVVCTIIFLQLEKFPTLHKSTGNRILSFHLSTGIRSRKSFSFFNVNTIKEKEYNRPLLNISIKQRITCSKFIFFSKIHRESN